MSQPVFISYARDASRDKAEALHNALGGRTAFLDTADIALGERFPEALVDALFDARVVVIFAEPQYFTRWYCLLEFRIARTPFLRAVDRPGATAQGKTDALRGLVVALPPRGVDPMMERFPPLVQGRNWPAVDDIDAIAALVEAELAANPPTLRERYASVADADAARSFLLEATRLPPPMRIGNLPFVPQVGLAPTIGDAFVGRADDLWRIHDLLWTERGDPATAAGLTGSIEAIGGFGKTRLALEYLYRFGPRHFRGGLFWINAESDAELQLYDVLQALNPQAPSIEAVRQTPGGVPTAVARAIRSRPVEASTPLFIIDNVPEPEGGQPPRPLETWCPVLADVPVLTTSRTRVALGAGGSVVSLPIGTLDPAAAVELLSTGVQRNTLEDADWHHIAEWVGHLPLALEVLNRLLRSGEMTPRALLDLSREQRPSAAVDAAMESIRHVVPEGALRGITEAFSASYNLLTPNERYAARLIAWMAPAPLPAFVIDTFDPDIFPDGVRSKLRHRSFVTELRDGAAEYFGSMHRVLADFVRAQSTEPDKEVDVVASLLTDLAESAEGQGATGSAVVRACAPLASSVFGNWIAEQRMKEDFLNAFRFAMIFGVILAKVGQAELAGDLFESVTSASAQRLGREHLETLAGMSNLATTRRDRGDHVEAQELQERVVKSTLHLLGDEHPSTLVSMNNLANTLCSRGDFSRGQELQEQVLETRLRILGDEHPDTLTAMSNLAATKRERGDHTGAQELMERGLETMRRILGDNHPTTLTAMSNMAIILNDLGDHAGAKKLQERVLEVTDHNRGDEHPDTLNEMSNLAITLSNRGDHEGAKELQERALEGMKRIMGDEHPTTLSFMSNLATTLSMKGDHAGAQELQEHVLEAMQRILGNEHPSTLTTMNNLAVTRRDQGNLAGAQELQEQALKIMHRQLGLEHTLTTVTAEGLLRTYIARKDYASANHLFGEYLLWLLNREPTSITHRQRYIQGMLLSMLEADGNTAGQE